MTTEAIPPADTKAERDALLERLWLAQLRALVTIMEQTPAMELGAATLTACRQFLGDQGVTAESFKPNTKAGEKPHGMAEALAVLKDMPPMDEEPYR